MGKCIKCGHELKIWDDDAISTIWYKCMNLDCVIYKQSWTLSEHKDNQNWTVRHIRALEAENQYLKEDLVELKTGFEALLSKLKI